DRVVSPTEPYNWARFNNLAAKAAKGEFLLFLNDDIEIIEPDWLDTLLGEAQRPEVGAVGPLLLYPDRRIQHAGLFLAAMGQGRHAFRYLAEEEPGYFGLARTQDDLAPDGEPNRVLVTGGPALNRDDIRKVLVVKLDHIGDCIIAFPAVRRLQRHFPKARITVLTSRASKSVWAMEPNVAETIEFDFFHARSALGEIELSAQDWATLRERRVPERFDLAIDLRKHPETRDVLRHSGARYLAGFDHRNLFAWLDVALDWGGDRAYARKRQHTADDLINLVDAVAAACEDDRLVIAAPPSTLPAQVEQLVKRAAGGRLVCVRPAAG